MIYDLRHRTTFTYEDVVSVSHHVLHLAPRRHRRQRCFSAEMLTDSIATYSYPDGAFWRADRGDD